MPDFRDFKDSRGNALGSKDQKDDEHQRWWEMDGKEQADAIGKTVWTIEKSQAARTAQIIAAARLYGNMPMFGLAGSTYLGFSAVQGTIRERVTFNVVQSVVDTVTAKMVKNKPKPYYLTSGADWRMQSTAKKRNKLLTAIFFENDAYRLGELAFRDCGVWGDGVAHVYEHNGRVKIERVPSHELFIDQVEAFYGYPRQLHRQMSVDRDVLAKTWPKRAEPIEAANPSPLEGARLPNVANSVLVRESWHLPSGPKAKDGRHVISIAGEVLLSEAWEHDHFPFAFLPWCPRMHGFWSQGLAEQLQSIQLELNSLLYALQVAYRRACLQMWTVENGSKIVKAHIDNEIGRIINYTGTEPHCVTPPVASPEIYEQIETLIRRAYELGGVSLLSATGQKPLGVNSGKAMRTLGDIESDRFTTIGKQYERFYLDIGYLCISVARDIAERDGYYEAVTPERMSTRTVRLDAEDLADDDSYVMQCFPISSLPDEPAGRFETVQEWVQAGWYTPEEGKRLMDFPDMEKLNSLANSMDERLEEILDAIVNDGDYAPPEPYYNLQLCLKTSLQYLIQAESMDVAPERLEMLRRFRDHAQLLAEMAMPPPMAGAPGAAPPALPLPPAQSPLLPNVAGANA